MLYNDMPLLHVAVVFAVVPALYWLFNRFTEWSPRFSDWLEGAPLLLVEDGRVHMENFRQLRLTQKKLFGELRQHQVEHLGQVRRAYMETTGNLSIYFYPETEPVRPGLPTWPERFRHLQRRAGAPRLLPLRPRASPGQGRPGAVPHLLKRPLAARVQRVAGGLSGHESVYRLVQGDPLSSGS